MPITVLADANIPGLPNFLGAQVNIRTYQGRSLDSADLAGVDALLVRSVTPVGKTLLQGSAVKFVGTATSGFEHVDRRYLASAGIAFAHAPGSNANSVVEYVLAAIAEDGQRLEDLFNGARVGIIGCGNVGRALLGRLEALGIDYACYDPWLEPASVPRAAELGEILQCEVVSLHCELTQQPPWPSHHLIGQRELRQQSPDALLINASRGSVIDNTALQRAFFQGYAPRTVLDVWEGEPDISAGLLEKVFLGTAHIAGYSLDGKILATAMLCRALWQTLDVDFRDTDPLPAEALPERPAQSLEQGLSGVELVRELLRSSYAIRHDDAQLRGATLGVSHVEARQRFDELRRDYGPRRELAGTRVLAKGMSEADKNLVAALGCDVLSSSDPGTAPT